jgi:hypothetical protein
MFGKRIMRALGFAALMTMGFANAQTCTPTSPRLDSGATFAAFNELERLEVRGGRAGTADWEWGVGKNTQTTGQFASGNLDWVSGRTLDWTLTYGSNGSATLTVKNGTSQTLSLSYATAPNGMRSGNALKLYAKTTVDAGEAKVYVVPKSINGKEVTGDLETQGNSTLSEKSLFYYFPAMSSGFTAKGTVKFTFTGTAPPQGSRMSFLVTAGNITCGTATDTTAPTISGQAPNSLKLNTATPVISAQYADVSAGIDTTKVTLLVDGTNVTAQATVSATGVTYTPSTALTNGAHTVQLNVADKANNPAQASWSFTVDTQLPTISGQSPNNTAVNTTKPTISAQYADMGTGIDLSKTVLTIDGATVTGQATATGISYIPATAIAAGTHNATLKVSDQAGNSTQSAWSFSVDVIGPVISVLVPANAAAISNNRPAISAQYADAGAGIDTTKTVLTVDGVNVTAQATATATGISYSPATALTSAAHTIVLKVFDKAGNSSQSTWSFMVSAVVTDTTAPTISGQAPNGLNLNSATPIISAQYADTGTGVDTTKVTLLVDGSNVTAQATVSATGVTHTPTIALTNGNHIVQLNIADKASNPAQASWSFTVDTQVPTISGQSPNNSSVNSASPAITAQYADVGAGIDLTKTVFIVDDANVTAQATATATGIIYTPATALATGAHTVSLKVFDLAGNSTQATWAFSVDIAGPVISAQVPANAATIGNTQPAISAQYADLGAGIDTTKTILTVDGVNVTAQAAATAIGISYTPTAPLNSGVHAVVLKVFDKAGNSSQASWSFSVDNGAPVITGQTPKDVSINNAKPTISAQYADSGVGVDTTKTVLTIDGADVTAQAQATATGINYTPATAFAGGAHTVVLKVVDNAGNPAQTTWTFTVDTQGPAINNLQPNNVIVGANPISVITAQFSDQGAGIDTSKVTLTVDGADVTSQAQITANGIAYAAATAYTSGVHNVTLKVSDLAGNEATSNWSFTTDADGPTISGQSPIDVSLPADALPTITAQFADRGLAGVNAGSVKLIVDGVDVTAKAVITSGQISYTPTQALAAGNHVIQLTVADAAGNTTTANWQFKTASAPTFSLETPKNVTLTEDALPLISATFAAQGNAGINSQSVKLLLDGTDVTALATVSATSISFKPSAFLTEGIHTVLLSAADAQGNTGSTSWQFTTKSPPSIAYVAPFEVAISSTVAPRIIARYFDLSGIDLATVAIWVDGVIVTGSAQVLPDAVIFEPVQPLAVGSHGVVVQVADKKANLSQIRWQFEVAPPPVITNQLPGKSVLQPNSRPTISASFSEPISGINQTQTKFVFEGVDVTSLATITGNSVSFLPNNPLPAGTYLAALSVKNNAGVEAKSFWAFDVDVTPTYQLNVVSPLNQAVVNSPLQQIKVVADSNVAAVVALEINGVAATLELDTATQSGVFVRTIPLVEGTNAISATARYSDGQSRTTSSTVMLDGAPKITVTAPQDFAILGAINPNSPRDLTGNVERPTTIVGRLSKTSVKVSVNQQQAQINGLDFRFENFFLHEGINLLTLTAVDAGGRVGTTSITVFVDQTAPSIIVESPLQDSVTSNAKIDVRGLVNDAVAGGVNAPYPTITIVNDANSHTKVGRVSDQFFFVGDVSLEVGTNKLKIIAEDHVGNKREKSVVITRIATGSDRLTLLSGDRQKGLAKSLLTNDLVVVALDKEGNPLANLPVQFDVARGTGSVSSSASASNVTGSNSRNLQVNTDASGAARVRLTLGKQSGEAANVVRASARGIAESVVFTATSDREAPAFVLMEGGGSQFAETGSAPLEPLSVVVVDANRNNIPNVPVTFTARDSAAVFSSGTSEIVVMTDKDGRATVRPTLGNVPGTARITAKVKPDSASGIIQAIDGPTFQIVALKQRDGPTQFTGKVLDHTGVPIPGVRLSIGRTNLSTTSDQTGAFRFDSDVPPGRIDLFIDGRTAQVAGKKYPSLHFEVSAIRGQVNVLPHAIYLPPLLTDQAKVVGGDKDVTLTIPGFEGFEMIVKANSATFPDGSKVGSVIVSPIHLDKLPMVPTGGSSGFMAPALTIQPSGTRFDPPIEIRVPNNANLLPGERRSIAQWDHDLAMFVPMGTATVTEDGAQLVTDPGAGVTKAGWFGCTNCPPPPPRDKCTADDTTPEIGSLQLAVISIGKPRSFLPTVFLAVTSPKRCPQSSYDWSYGDGGTGSGSAFSFNFYTKSGTYTPAVTLTCVNTVCEKSYSASASAVGTVTVEKSDLEKLLESFTACGESVACVIGLEKELKDLLAIISLADLAGGKELRKFISDTLLEQQAKGGLTDAQVTLFAMMYAANETLFPTNVLDIIPGGKAVKSTSLAIKSGEKLGEASILGAKIAQAERLARLEGREIILAEVGVKGDWSKLLNLELKPNAEYLVRNPDTGFTHKFSTDANGRVVSASGDLNPNKLDRNNYQQGVVGEAGGPGYEGGHLIACSLGGCGDAINIVPQLRDINRTEYREMEREWARRLEAGERVSVDVRPVYKGDSITPDKIVVDYRYGDGPITQKVFTNVK